MLYGEQRLLREDRAVDSGMEADFMWARLAERRTERKGIVAPWSWADSQLDEAMARFEMRYDEARLDGVSSEELAELYLLYREAMAQTDAHVTESDELARTMASVVGAAVGVAVVFASGGTLGPVAVGALAGTLGGGAAAATGAAIRSESSGAEIARDFGAGFVEGSLAAAFEPLVAGSALVRGAGRFGARAAGDLGASAVGRTTAGRVTAGLVSNVIEGSIGGAAGELYMTATEQATWRGTTNEVLARLLVAVGRGATLGAVGGVAGTALAEGVGAVWRRMASRHGVGSVRDIQHAFNDLALGHLPSRFDDAQVEALFEARRLALAGDDHAATALLVQRRIVAASDAPRMIEAIRARRVASELAAEALGERLDHPVLAARLGLHPDDVILDPTLGVGTIELHYGVGLRGTPRLRVRAGLQPTGGDVLIHAEAAREVRAFFEEAGILRGTLERVRAWLRGGTLSTADELAIELRKHARMIEARERALSGLPLDAGAAARLQDDIVQLREAASTLRTRLAVGGVPEGVIRADLDSRWRRRMGSEAYSDLRAAGRDYGLTDSQLDDALELIRGRHGFANGVDSPEALRGWLRVAADLHAAGHPQKLARVLRLARSTEERRTFLVLYNRFRSAGVDGTSRLLSEIVQQPSKWRGGMAQLGLADKIGVERIAAFELDEEVIRLADGTTRRRVSDVVTRPGSVELASGTLTFGRGTRIEVKDWRLWRPERLERQMTVDLRRLTSDFTDAEGIRNYRLVFTRGQPQVVEAVETGARLAEDEAEAVLEVISAGPLGGADTTAPAAEAHSAAGAVGFRTRSLSMEEVYNDVWDVMERSMRREAASPIFVTRVHERYISARHQLVLVDRLD
ncbi:MAG: hypothetical protein KF901_33150 [Myxococcales bacterium]|nr:hypothetical protein [Myxococcales bacterium]